jgi:chromosome segregation ATPase
LWRISIERKQRLRLAVSEISRFIEERGEVEKALVETELLLADVSQRKSAIEEEIQFCTRRGEELRIANDALRRDLSGLQSQFAVLQERRSTVARELAALGQQSADLERRAADSEMRIQQAAEQQEQTRVMIESLEQARAVLARERDELDSEITGRTATLEELRRELHEAEAKWDETRSLSIPGRIVTTPWKSRRRRSNPI